jgi:conjugal transfer pilus assembly protein TraD
VALIGWTTADRWDLHAAPFRYLALAALTMAGVWLPGALRVWRRHYRLRGKPLAFIAPPDLKRQVGRGENLWLDWTGRHAQLMHDLLRTGPARLSLGTSARLGADWIHGIGTREREVRLALAHTEGHLLIVGITGAGKTRLFDLLVTQAVLRGGGHYRPQGRSRP